MLFWLVYLLLFAFALWFFAATIVAYWFSSKTPEKQTLEASHASLEAEKQIAALEAQFLLAPRMALTETRALCDACALSKSEDGAELQRFLLHLERLVAERAARQALG